jgi:hypothetical protein
LEIAMACSARFLVRLFSLVVFLSALALAGCGPRTGIVSGKVTYKNAPLGSGTITFIGGPKGDKSQWSPISADGSYQVSNVPVGNVKITVETTAPSNLGSVGGMKPPSVPGVAPPPDQSTLGGADATKQGTYVPIPGKYKDAEQSGLSMEVKPGKQEHNVDLAP